MAKKTITQTGSKAIRAHFLDAQRALEDNKPAEDPDPNTARTFEGIGAIKPGQWDGAPWNAMPPGCPVRVLGSKGATTWVVSANGELFGVERWDQAAIMKLFAPYPNYALWAWPAFGDGGKDAEGNPLPPKVKRLERDKCMTALIVEAGRRGIFDPADQLRGRGGWKTDDGEFLWHSGRALWTVKRQTVRNGLQPDPALQVARPSEYMGHFYAQDSGILEPWMTSVETRESPAHSLWQALTTWNWERPWLDPVLYLGWIATALMGAALNERPIIFVTGGRGTGKSTLHDITKAVMGRLLYSTANTTAAGIYQNIKQDSRPVMVDEFEAKARGDKEQSIIEIARQAYSGATLYRGGQNHDGVEFALRCSFGFSAIIPPPLTVQDRSRMAILNLKPLAGGNEAEPVIDDECGRMMLRQVLDGWQEFNQVLLPRWRRRLHHAGFDARMIDTYGTLLAAAELLIGELGLIDARFHEDAMNRGKLDEEMVIAAIRDATRAEIADQEEKWETVIDKILTAPIENWTSGQKPTVGATLEDYERGLKNAGGLELAEARARLALAGLGLKPSGDATEGYALAIPKAHPALDRIFGDTDFRAGNWYTALKQAPQAIVPRGLEEKAYTVKISKVAKYCLLVDMEAYDRRMG